MESRIIFYSFVLMSCLNSVCFCHTSNRTKTTVQATVYLRDERFVFKDGTLDKSGAAYAQFSDSLLETGWGVLDIRAGFGQSVTNEQLHYAAGYLEGYLTSHHMWNQYVNLEEIFFKDPSVKQNASLFFVKQTAWAEAQVRTHKVDDPVFRQLGYVLAQFNGLRDGFADATKTGQEKAYWVVSVLNANGDLFDIMHVVNPLMRPNFEAMNYSELKDYVHRNSHCSALVKILGAYENLFMSHSSWFMYQATNRIYKHYDFNVDDSAVASSKMSFSSYAGYLESLDDFYLMSSKIVLLQTTNNIFNNSLYDLVIPESLLAWQRVRIANALAHSGPEWAKYFSQHNSGTYNNQYMIIDLKRIILNKTIEDDALWVVEQIPGMVVSADQTPILRTGYWPSYNVPFFEAIYNTSGYPGIVAKHGLDFSYQLAPRAKIFRRDQDNVVDMDSMKNIMRYNDYVEDPYSENDPCDTICCRGDLNNDRPVADGCYDTKVSDYSMAMNFESLAISGPTRSHSLKPFSWTGQFAEVSHVGLPTTYNFPWIYMKPSL